MASQTTHSTEIASAEPIPFTERTILGLPGQDSPQSESLVSENARSNPRLIALSNKKAQLEATLAELKAQRAALVSSATLSSGLTMAEDSSEEQRTNRVLATANAVIKEHIAMLTKYNEIKDVGQELMGLLAEQRGARISEVMADFDVTDKD